MQHLAISSLTWFPCIQAHYGTLLRLKQYFPFSLIDAMGSLEECRHQIVRELRYQSSMDLEEATYSAIRHLPLARELVRTSRQQLVSHLDGYCRKHNAVFKQVLIPPPPPTPPFPTPSGHSIQAGSPPLPPPYFRRDNTYPPPPGAAAGISPGRLLPQAQRCVCVWYSSRN